RVGGRAEGRHAGRAAEDAALLRLAHERGLAHERLEASAVAAHAQRAVLDDRGVADLARAAGGAAKYDPVDHDPGAHSGSDRDDEEVLVPTPCAVQALGHGEGVDVVLDEHGQLQLTAQALAERHPGPPELRRDDDALALAIDGAGYSDTDAEQATARAAGDEPCEQRREVGEHRGGVRVEALARRAQARAVDSDSDEGDAIGADLHADRRAAALREAEPAGGAATLRGLMVEFADETVGEQLLGELRHERRRAPEHPCEFGPR